MVIPPLFGFLRLRNAAERTIEVYLSTLFDISKFCDKMLYDFYVVGCLSCLSILRV